MSTDEQIEQEIQRKGLTAPRVTQADIEAEIASEHYFTAADAVSFTDDGFKLEKDQELALGLLTFCVLILRNGFTVTGKSACASPENFDAELGRKIARQDALNQLWPLLGFRLRDQLTRGPIVREHTLTDEEIRELASRPGIISQAADLAVGLAVAESASASYDCNAGYDSGSCGGVD